MTNEPVQVVVNPGETRRPRKPPTPNGNGHDFFKDDDEGFRQHRDRLADTLTSLLAELEHGPAQQEFGGLGHIKVVLSERGIAKSHRPQSALFRAKRAPHVATDHIGEPIFAVTPHSLREIIADVRAAEIDVALKFDKRTETYVPNPSRKRCEVGAIADVALWSPADKRAFSAEDGAAWLAQSGTGGSYMVEMFPALPAQNNAELAIAQQRSRDELHAALQTLSAVETPVKRDALMTGLRVVPPVEQTLTARAGENPPTKRPPTKPLDAHAPSPARMHEQVLNRIARNPLVREILLPPVVRSADVSHSLEGGEAPAALLSGAFTDGQGKVGVIDGGIGGPINNWVVERWGQLADHDQDLSHGTFITGLLVAGSALNPYLPPTPTGCRVYDIDVLPRDAGGSSQLFASYYPNGVPDFMDEVEDAVETYREEHGVRVFNFSMNVLTPNRAAYGYTSRRLDEIARRLDVIFVVSAGNLSLAERRPEWDLDPARALADLTGDTVGFVGEPGQSIYNASVSALNPPGLEYQQPYALARYSRRGPGVRGATKPDFAQVGGSGTPTESKGHNLWSVTEAGTLQSSAGSSYAAPLVARQIADLDAAVEGNLTRETLLALTVHHATQPPIMRHKTIAPAARDLVGFGIPATAEEMLEGDDSHITIVIHNVLRLGEDAKFEFTWPESLVTPDGKCRGYARLTLVTQPRVSYQHGDERIRINVDAGLRQMQADGGFRNRLDPILGKTLPAHATERELLKEALKWQVVRGYEFRAPKGRGPSTTWQFVVEYLTRADEQFPDAGVPFAAVLTIGDLDGKAPVFQEMRQAIANVGLRTADIRTQIQPRAQI
jgi:hypothetical protein